MGSQPSQEIPDDEEHSNELNNCFCGAIHKKAPKFMPFEYMRLAHALADPSVRPHTSRFFEGHSRAVLDANDEAPFIALTDLFNSAEFKPEKQVVLAEVDEIPELDPAKRAHLRSAKTLRAKFNDLKADITAWNSNYTKSGNHDASNHVSFVLDGNMGKYYAWRFFEETNLLQAITRELPAGIGAEDGGATPVVRPPRKRVRLSTARPSCSPTAAPASASTDVILAQALTSLQGVLEAAAARSPPSPPEAKRERERRARREENRQRVETCVAIASSSGVSSRIKTKAQGMIAEFLEQGLITDDEVDVVPNPDDANDANDDADANDDDAPAAAA